MRHLASFRVRVFLFTALVAVVATTATAWLTLRDASSQITASATAERETVDALSNELSDYAVQHGTWEGVAGLVADLTTRSGQRLRLTTLEGQVVVDSENLAGRASRPPSSAPPRVVQPRPAFTVDDVPGDQIHDVTMRTIDRYRWQVRQAACLSRRGIPVLGPWPGENGVPELTLSAKARHDTAAIAACVKQTASTDQERRADATALSPCLSLAKATPSASPSTAPEPRPRKQSDVVNAVRSCAVKVFTARTERVAPVPLLLYLGFERQGDGANQLSLARGLAAAGIVALVVLAGTLLLSHRVVRPISTITDASRRLGAGDLSGRVAVRGRDEVAELARAFNRMAEQLQDAEARQRRMISDIAHELRTPLANLRGYLEALADGVLTPSPELFVSLHEEAVLQQRIVDDLQELALAEAGVLRYRDTPVDVADLLESCRIAHQAAADAGDVTLRVDEAETLTVRGDSDRLRQAVANLVANALNATPPGGVVVLRGHRVGERVVMEVADTGHGIAPADQSKVFDRFWRADAARGRRTGGSGLGLAITKEFVAAHGGTIGVTSEPGTGTTFTISLPAEAPTPG